MFVALLLWVQQCWFADYWVVGFLTKLPNHYSFILIEKKLPQVMK